MIQELINWQWYHTAAVAISSILCVGLGFTILYLAPLVIFTFFTELHDMFKYI